MEKTEKPRTLVFCAVLAFCAALAAHAPSLAPNLLWDDALYIGSNPFAADCSNLGTVLNPVNLVKVLPVPLSARPLTNDVTYRLLITAGNLRGEHDFELK